MRVVIAAVSSNAHMSGVSRHAANVVRCLLTRSDVTKVHLLVSPWEYKYVCEAVSRRDSRLHVHAVSLRPGTLHRNLWYYRQLPAIATQLKADVVHISYPSPIQRRAFHCPVVVTLHDLYPYDVPENFGFPKVLFNRLVLQECLRSADAIACVSESTRLSLTARMPEAISNKAITVYNCVEASVTAVKPSFLDDWAGDPFFLCVAQHRRNKNILLLLQVFKELLSGQRVPSPSRLLIVGMSGPETAQINHYIRESGLKQHVMLESGITDSELQWCYRNCEALLAPSAIEGFGLPVAEALLAGCRVVCSAIPAFSELGGSLCRFVTLGPKQVEEFASAVCDALKERRPSPTALPKLCATVIAEQYMHLYNFVAATFTLSGRSPAFARPFAQVPGIAEGLTGRSHK